MIGDLEFMVAFDTVVAERGGDYKYQEHFGDVCEYLGYDQDKGKRVGACIIGATLEKLGPEFLAVAASMEGASVHQVLRALEQERLGQFSDALTSAAGWAQSDQDCGDNYGRAQRHFHECYGRAIARQEPAFP